MVRIVDLDSMNPTDITDSNYLIVANTNGLYRTSRLSFANALSYFITTNAVSASTVTSMIEAYVSDDSVSLANTDNFVTLSASPSFTLNQTGNKTITLGHKTKEVTANSTSNTNYHAVKNISIDNAAHITQIISEDQSLLFIPRSEFDFQITGDTILQVGVNDTFTDANRTINITHKGKNIGLNNITSQNNYFVNSIAFDSFGHVSNVTTSSVEALVNDSYVTQLITESLTSDSSLIDDAIRSLIDSAYISFIVDSDYVMARHSLSEPTLSNIQPTPGRYLNSIIFDDYGHPVEVTDVSVEDYVDTDYVMRFHQVQSSAISVVGDSARSTTGGLVFNTINFDNDRGHVANVGRTNLDNRYLRNLSFITDRIIRIEDSSYSSASISNTSLTVKHKTRGVSANDYTTALSVGSYFDTFTYDSFGHAVSITASTSGNLDTRIKYIADSSWVMLNHDKIHSTDSNKVGTLSRDYINSISFDKAGHIISTSTLRLDQYIDSDYIRTRTNDLYLDSNEAIGIINNTVDSSYALLKVLPTIDSAYINARVVIPDAGIDSAAVTLLIDSAYVASRIGPVGIDSAAVAAIVDSALTLFTLDSNVTVHSNLYVDSDIIAAGNITAFGSFSDESLKENVVKIEGALDRIDLMTGYTFNYISKPDVRMTGVMAGDAENALPELVYTTSSGHKAVHYGNALGLLVEGIKELRKEVEEIKKKLN